MNSRRLFIILFCLLLCAALCLSAGCSFSAPAADGIGAKIVINEVMSSNSLYAPAGDGACYDWVELKNTGEAAAELGGWYLSDEPDDPLKWKLPDASIEPGGFLLIYLSGEEILGGEELHADFRLSSSGETLVLSDKYGKVADRMKVPETPQNVSFGLDSDGRKTVWFAEPTPDAENSGEGAAKLRDLVFPVSPVVINEFMTNNFGCIRDCDGDCPDWVELYNPSDSPADLSGYFLTDDIENPDKWRFPDGVIIPARGYLIVFCSGKCFFGEGELHTDFRLGGGDGEIALFTPGLVPNGSVGVPETGRNVSCGRLEDGTYALFSSATPGRENSTAQYEMRAAKGETAIE